MTGKLGGDLFEISLADHLAVAVEFRVELDLQALDVKVAVNDAAALEGQRVLDIEIALDRPQAIDVLADDVTLDNGLLADCAPAFRENLALEGTIDPNVVRGGNLTFDDSSGGDFAHFVHIYVRFHCFSHIVISPTDSIPSPFRGSSCT